MNDIKFTGTYSPEDNKLRIYASDRLPRDLYLEFKEAGFKYAPKQKLFVAPMWTPSRRDFVIKICDFIQDELTSVEDRAIQRAERFTGYHENRLEDATNAYNESVEIAGSIPTGQPIHVGHHSQRRAEKDAEKIERKMSKAVEMWDRADYWQGRIKGVLDNVKYKESLSTRLNRIKRLEKDQRRYKKEIDNSMVFIKLWNDETHELTYKRAMAISGRDRLGVYSALYDKKIDEHEAKEKSLTAHERHIEWYADWLNHVTLRLDYENSILKATGYVEPEKVKRKLPPIVNYDGGEKFVKITKEQYKKIRSESRFCRKSECGTHRIRYVCNMHLENPIGDHWSSSKVFIVDQKEVRP